VYYQAPIMDHDVTPGGLIRTIFAEMPVPHLMLTRVSSENGPSSAPNNSTLSYYYSISIQRPVACFAIKFRLNSELLDDL
jgi:hypothetical protein